LPLIQYSVCSESSERVGTRTCRFPPSDRHDSSTSAGHNLFSRNVENAMTAW
jgi:hypothetical protein